MKSLRSNANHCRLGFYPRAAHPGFSLVEVLVVVTVIGILSTLIVSSITGAARDSRMVVARQQQAVLQEALNSWIAAASSGTNSLSAARSAYAAASTASAKLALLQPYLQASTYEHFANYSSGTAISSEALQRVGASLQFSTWSATNYPSVDMSR